MSKEINTVYTVKEWQQLELDVFHDAGEALTKIKQWANYKRLPPVAALVMAALKALASLPAGTTFDAGLGAGALNTFVALVGAPGQGKDRLASAIATDLPISHKDRRIDPVEAQIGSGEGMVSMCQPDSDSGHMNPVLFHVSEVGSLETLMRRKGSTLRTTLMSIYSGNPLGSTNKNDKTYVPRNSYTACLWAGCQPDKAGALLDGADDGLAHRFIWVEVINPVHVDHRDDVALRTVDIPDDIDKGITFPEPIKNETRRQQEETLRHGAPGGYHGHRRQTQLKLAAGLALLRSTRAVSMDDWERAGVLMSYSDRVCEHAQKHLEARRVDDNAKRMEQREEAEARLESNRVTRNRNKILDALDKETPVQWAGRGGLLQRGNSRDRDALPVALEELVREGKVSKIEIVRREGEPPVTDSIERGSNYDS